jgi:L-lactate dehydrogenase (cytochrome)
MSRTRIVAPVTPADYRLLAERRLPRFLFDYADGGANDELTMAANAADFGRLTLRQRVMRDVSAIDTSTSLAGQPVSMPLALAPVGMAGMFARRGEVQGMRAAGRAGVPFTLSTVGICPIEEVRAAAVGPFWFQLYMMRDREVVQRLLRRARDGGCTALLFTVDLPVAGLRHRDTRNGMIGRDSFRAKLAKAWQIGTRPRWVMWLRGLWEGKLFIKGVLEPDDARAAADAGADGVVVSNHGGRQLDSVASSIAKLPGVVAAAGDRLEVLVDGGVRSGIDVLKALALGARGVLIGRPWIWAMAGAGSEGLSDLLTTFSLELRVAMALAGVRRIDEITPQILDQGNP